MKAIATISSRDPEIGQVIAEIYDKIGKDGVITTEEVKQVGITHEIVDGMQIDSGKSESIGYKMQYRKKVTLCYDIIKWL